MWRRPVHRGSGAFLLLCCAVGVDPQPNGPTPFSPAVLRDSHPLRAGFTGLPGLCGRSPRQGPLRRPCPRLRLRAAPAPSLPPLTAHPRRPQLLPMAAKGFAAPAEPNTQGERPCTATTEFPTFSLCLPLVEQGPLVGQEISHEHRYRGLAVNSGKVRQSSVTDCRCSNFATADQ